MSTPPEEIKRQHALAEEIVSTNSIPHATLLNHGEIPLTLKQFPTTSDPFYSSKKEGDNAQEANEKKEGEEKINEDTAGKSVVIDRNDANCCVSTRGIIDVTTLASLVSEGHNDPAPPPPKKNKNGTKTPPSPQTPKSLTNLWDLHNAIQNNVNITRPAHDAWGIKKIVLIFCDDFLHNIYELPWWHSPTPLATAIRAAFQPILTTLHITPSRLVRCLFASLPPQTTIPLHHDTGEWVKHTHRVHIPVLVENPNKIVFLCGPSEDQLVRVECKPGHVFELNNQGKHCVSNCHDTEHRVHIILDYVDENFHIPHRIELNAGETLLQTRRSIDRVVDAGKRPTPSFFILGSQKAGTTSLYDYLNQHPLIVRAKKRETHCLDWRWDDSLQSTDKRREHCLSFFYTKELYKHPSLVTGESTPSYLLDSQRCIERMKEVFPRKDGQELKFFIICRDPVKRARSHYAMVTSLDGTEEQIKTRGKEWLNKSFEDVVLEDIRNMKEDGLLPYWNMETQSVDLEVFDAFVDSQEEEEAWVKYLKHRIPISTGSHSCVSRGLYALNMKPWFRAYDKDQFCVFKMEDWKKDENGIKNCMNRAFHHLGLPQVEVQDESPKNTRSYEFKEKGVGLMLQKFYEPHNKRLCKILDGEEWKDPWPYGSD